MTKAIELNDAIRGFATSSPIAMLCVAGMYLTTGKVNTLDLCELERAAGKSVRVALEQPPLRREDFDTDEAYHDQANNLVIMQALSTTMNGKFKTSTIPGMVKELYQRIHSTDATSKAYYGISESLREVEKSMMDKIVSELY